MGIGQVKSRAAVFLDRDGVLNRAIVRDGKPYPPQSADEMEILPDASASLRKLKNAGFLLIVVTNQPDVGRGRQTKAAVEQMHAKLRQSLPIDDFFVCYHDDADACECRKPLPGLLIEAARVHGLRLKDSFLVGDRWRDVDAGNAAGVRTVWVDYGYHERGPKDPPAARVKDLPQAAAWILATMESDVRESTQ